MKRPRNVDCGKIRRPLKRSKITDGIYGSTFLYLRFLLVWALVLMADFILEFRFEYLWPFWLLLRSVYDSFKYQGLAFSVFFVCIAITSDVICYLFIPVQWLFFAASTYVWVQYVWHTERGICLPTVSLWLLFVYIEASIRLRELKSLPFNLDLCRPFACHCIGYPVVTLGFGFKSYVSYRMRLRRQKVIQKENDFYLQILQQALPAEVQYADKPKALPSKADEDVISNGVSSSNKKVSLSKLDDEKDSSSPVCSVKTKSKGGDINEDDEIEYIEKSLPRKPSNVNQFDENSDNFTNEQQVSKGFKSGNSSVAAAVAVAAASAIPVPSNKTSSKQLNSSKDSGLSSTTSSNSSLTHPPSSSSTKKGKNMYRELQPSPSPLSYTNNKEEVIQRLESDVKKLKADLQASRNSEHELRSQISSSSSEEKAMRSELYQLQQDNENLQNKLHNLVTSRQQDRQTIATLEKKLTDEKKAKAVLEQQLANEKKSKTVEAAAAARAVAMATAARGECTDSCKARRRDFDNEMKQLRRDNKLREDQYRQLEREVQALRQYKDAQKETEVLMKALSTMQDKNTELENNLCAETRFKQELFSALGKERNEIKILQNLVAEKDTEILELKSKIAEVMALIPSPAVTTYSHHSNERNSSPLFSSSFSPAQDRSSMQVYNGNDLASSSELNPNASDYKPKSVI
ncbi:macoilin-1-like isoform X2 [Physella acuta]|uniref:macoilin-1-like isoform X2 n=1 Tax=Physella acuta TaxID=109671 RepID=UPI0027DE7712|nr:macoilin-1-like isoform X2 [Physella acuta]